MGITTPRESISTAKKQAMLLKHFLHLTAS